MDGYFMGGVPALGQQQAPGQQQVPGDMMFGGGALTPEQQQAFMDFAAGQGTWTEQDRAIQQQLAQAVALKNRGVTPHTTGPGAMLGGMGDVLNQVTGMQQEKKQRAADTVLQQGRIKALRDLAEKNRQLLLQRQQQPPEMLRRPDMFTPPYTGY